MATDDKNLTFSASAATLLANNAAVPFTRNQLVAIARGNIEWKYGCIQRLLYMTGDKDLRTIQWEDGSYTSAVNIQDFQASIELALGGNHALGFCYDKEARKISMLWVYRCGCRCRKEG